MNYNQPPSSSQEPYIPRYRCACQDSINNKNTYWLEDNCRKKVAKSPTTGYTTAIYTCKSCRVTCRIMQINEE